MQPLAGAQGPGRGPGLGVRGGARGPGPRTGARDGAQRWGPGPGARVGARGQGPGAMRSSGCEAEELPKACKDLKEAMGGSVTGDALGDKSLGTSRNKAFTAMRFDKSH